jgi:hypothetical protein
MADNTIDIDSVSDYVSPDALAALGNKATTNKPDISRLPDAIVGGVAQFSEGDKIVIERYSSFLRGKPYLDTKTYRVVRLDEFTGRIHLFDEQLDQNAIMNWKESLKFGTVFKLAVGKVDVSTKKKRGRPRKNPVDFPAEVKPEGEKRGRGRPKGAKNRDKETIATEKAERKAARAKKAALKARKAAPELKSSRPVRAKAAA